MKRYLLSIILLAAFLCAEAKHITGGEMFYEYVETTAQGKRYKVTLILFRDELATNAAAMPPSVIISSFNNDNAARLENFSVTLQGTRILPLNALPNCITNAPNLSYSAGTYVFYALVPSGNTTGITLAYQTCCRIDGISNVPNSTGATYTSVIPGTNTVSSGLDNSPQFAQAISVVCFERPFTLDFSATDSDGDSLVYFFCGAYDGGAASNAEPINASPPPYGLADYINGYSGGLPLGSQASIDPSTGIISGIAPAAGRYVVSVCVNSFDRVTKAYKATHRKDFIITVAPCDIAGVQLKPSYLSCDGFTFTFNNLNSSPLNETVYWDFGDGNTSTDVAPVHTYAVAGDYILKLVVNRGDDCADSATAPLKVYPGFFPAFTSTSPTCKGVPVQFTDGTTANYGQVNYWKWEFGIAGDADSSRIRNPLFTYTTPNTYDVTLIVGSDRGCLDTLVLPVEILDKAPYTLTNDTLICNIDTLQLNFVTANPGTISWSPNYMISNTAVFSPLVSPDVTTTYRVSYADNFGCTAVDSVTVRVVDRVTLSGMADSTICRTDAVTLALNSDALQYQWTPAATLNDATVQDPVATPTAPFTSYAVIANIGKCFARDTINISTVPYPVANAGKDSTICFGNSLQLNASGGSIYSWSPRIFLSNSNIANPVAQSPQQSIDYVVTVRDVLGCPKPVNDTIRVTVARIIADAGPADTNVVMGQPLQLNATGSVNYQWTPSTWLSNPSIFNPVSLPQESIRYVVRVSNEQGCFDTDTINVKLFNIDPDLLVPSGFSPDNDGLNDIFRPIVIGMKSLNAFRVYNRWGQLVYSTTQVNDGWDGNFKGAPQSAGTYVWYAEGITYLGRKVEKKGTMILIR